MTLLSSNYYCAHFADGDMESLIGLNSCKAAGLTAEPELLAPPQTHLKRYLAGELEAGHGAGVTMAP